MQAGMHARACGHARMWDAHMRAGMHACMLLCTHVGMQTWGACRACRQAGRRACLVCTHAGRRTSGHGSTLLLIPRRQDRHTGNWRKPKGSEIGTDQGQMREAAIGRVLMRRPWPILCHAPLTLSLSSAKTFCSVVWTMRRLMSSIATAFKSIFYALPMSAARYLSDIGHGWPRYASISG